jgi:hypothetical protein
MPIYITFSNEKFMSDTMAIFQEFNLRIHIVRLIFLWYEIVQKCNKRRLIVNYEKFIITASLY